MKYLVVELDKERYWIELDDDRYVNRQIILDEYNKFHVSCMEDCLADGIFNEADVEGNIINLAKQDFENIWQSVLKKYKKQWEKIKKSIPLELVWRALIVTLIHKELLSKVETLLQST